MDLHSLYREDFTHEDSTDLESWSPLIRQFFFAMNLVFYELDMQDSLDRAEELKKDFYSNRLSCTFSLDSSINLPAFTASLFKLLLVNCLVLFCFQLDLG